MYYSKIRTDRRSGLRFWGDVHELQILCQFNWCSHSITMVAFTLARYKTAKFQQIRHNPGIPYPSGYTLPHVCTLLPRYTLPPRKDLVPGIPTHPRKDMIPGILYPPLNRMTYTCENITFPQLRWRSVINQNPTLIRIISNQFKLGLKKKKSNTTASTINRYLDT